MVEERGINWRTVLAALAARLRHLTDVTPVTAAVAATALSAAMLFVVFDLARTVAENAEDIQIVEAMVSEIGGSHLMPAALTSVPIAAQAGSTRFIEAEALYGVWQRGAGAFAAAFIAIGFMWRRKESATSPDLAEKLASAQDEQRLLARRYHEEKLRAEAANHAKIAFLAHLSHDIRTPLNHIIGFADMMKYQAYGPVGDPRYLGYVETIKGSGERLLAFFASILELAEFEAGNKALRQDLVATDEMLSGVVRRFRAQAARAGVLVKTGMPTGAVLLGDRFCLERMLGNLIDNAIRFTPQGGRVTVASYAADNGIVLEVTDSGIGMPADRLAAVSQSFPFGDAGIAREQAGAGLGISIARAIAQQSGGHLAIDSRPGLGTTVAISLPLPSATATDQSQAA